MTILLRLVSLVTFFITTIGDTATQTGDSIGGAREVHFSEYTAIIAVVYLAVIEV